jgi:predicted nucleic acid-binding protein
MSVELFIDSNVLLYQLDTGDRRKHAIAERIVSEAVAHESACISFQVVQECLNTVLRKAEVRLDITAARAWLDAVLARLYRVPATLDLYRRALQVQERYRFAFYDSLIVAAALEAGCKRLLSEDLQHGQRIEKTLAIENPFRK